MAWLLMIVIAVAIVARPTTMPRVSDCVGWVRSHGWEIAVVTLITSSSFVLRIVALDRYAPIFTGDEGKFGNVTREIIAGHLRNPFETTFDAHPTLWIFLQAAVMRFFGDGVEGSRLFSCIIGTATVPLLYVFMRHHFGMPTAATGAAMLTVSHFHLFMSRDAQNNISAPFFLLLTLVVLNRVLNRWRPSDALALGLVIGLANYAYVANRILLPIVFCVLGITIVQMRPWSRSAWARVGRPVVESGLLIVYGCVLAILPLAAYYVDHQQQFSDRVNRVSAFGSGWLDAEQKRTGHGALLILWHQFRDATFLPFHTNPHGYFQIDPPFVGWPFAFPVAIGLGIATVNVFRRQYLGPTLAYWALVIGLALTAGPPQTNRIAMAAVLFPVFAAIGVMTIAHLARRCLRLPRHLVATSVVLFILGCGLWSVRLTFEIDGSGARALDWNTITTNTFGNQLHGLGPGYTVYFAAAPRIFYNGMPNLKFIAPGDTGIDVIEPWSALNPPPTLTGPTVFFFLPERSRELAVVRDFFPGGELKEQLTDTGEPLYTSYIVMPTGESTVTRLDVRHFLSSGQPNYFCVKSGCSPLNYLQAWLAPTRTGRGASLSHFVS